jgi:hypothetical protein
VNQACEQKWARLKTIVEERSHWAQQIASVKGMRQWVLDAEQILDGSWAKAGEPLSNKKVAGRFDRWRKKLARSLVEGSWTPVEQVCLEQFLHVLENLRPHLILCYDREQFPRTNNDMEGSIRGLKTRYRRISGRKNWNSYLLRYGRCVAYYDWWEQQAQGQQQLLEASKRISPACWRRVRKETTAAQSEQLKRFRFCHKREAYLASLEQRWSTAAQTTLLP